MARVELRQVTKLFGPLKAVDQADLEIADGEVLCLLGPSGCGKTTTLRMIAGLEWATSGDIGVRWGLLAAIETLFLIPVIVVVFVLQHHLLRGVTFGTIKR